MPARSYLLVPGHHDDAVIEALAGTTGADVIIIDLEDSVPPEARAQAVANLRREPTGNDVRVLCRIRPGLTNRLEDIAVLPPWVDGVLLAQASSAADVELVDEALRAGEVQRTISLLLESAYAVENLPELLAAAPIEAIMLGPHDLRSDVGLAATPDESELQYPRARMAFAARAAGVRNIVDGPYAGHVDGLRCALQRAGALGHTGKIILGADQAPVVNTFYANR
ncbi:HpcH/HpaI aldolase/citrate lyase family protein [Cumulibacter soli]|uniref:HpcH/HpaI aldolase/citrate lyase family protein n=1 Tax=Cumulibacter soli TaxID=2546344 RepID=UPI0010682CD8|nr:aldolase/citrate lyase family protein [Cumulibacter soli]